MRDQIADLSERPEGAAQQRVLLLAPAGLLHAHAEDTVGDRVEVGANLLQRVGLAVDDRLQQADQDVGAVPGFGLAARQAFGEGVEHLAGREADGQQPVR